nr:hypothetical protein [Sicyoidochytrium minutum DNA virus]
MRVKIAYYDDVLIALLKSGLPEDCSKNVLNLIGLWCCPKRVGDRVRSPSQIIGREMKDFFRLDECKRYRLYRSSGWSDHEYGDLRLSNGLADVKLKPCSKLTREGVGKLRRGEALKYQDIDWNRRIPEGHTRWLPVWFFMLDDDSGKAVATMSMTVLCRMEEGLSGHRHYALYTMTEKNISYTGEPRFRRRLRPMWINFFDIPNMSEFDEAIIQRANCLFAVSNSLY